MSRVIRTAADFPEAIDGIIYLEEGDVIDCSGVIISGTSINCIEPKKIENMATNQSCVSSI
tara:strand:+ start:1655 stop:1837 length:183 start_codon:yes stop_codon:yes gene_type:complete